MKANHNKAVEQKMKDTLFIRPNLRNNESKSQHKKDVKKNAGSCLSGPIYEIMKANHNPGDTFASSGDVVYQAQSTK